MTLYNVRADTDVLLLVAAQLQEFTGVCHPVIIDIAVFSMIECIRARDSRLMDSGGRWHNGAPQVVKKTSLAKYRHGEPLADNDYEKDTNFGKLKRIPYPPLQAFMRKHGAIGGDDED